MTKVVIVGGGTAGWFTAAWLAKKNPNVDITLIEDLNVPIIGVGESVTPHVAHFFRELGVDLNDWMFSTGSIYKYANKFVNWVNNQGEYEYFSFNYTTDSKYLYKDVCQPLTPADWLVSNNVENKTTDILLDMFKTRDIDRFDKFFNSQFYYMEKNVSPFEGVNYLLNSVHSQSNHINADQAGKFMRDKIAIPLGVKHLTKPVNDVIINENKIDYLLVDNEKIKADIFIDCTGFKKLLTRKLNWKETVYKDNPIDSAWVSQLEYTEPGVEMVNYTQSIAQSNGWLFKIGLYNRMGSGYCFSSNHISNEQALSDFSSMVKLKRTEPRLIKWTPSRLDQFGDGNVVSIGLSSGFVEPLEANALFIIVTGIQEVSTIIANQQKTNNWDFSNLNKKMAYALDDIADFLKVHYTLSKRTDSDFWNDMSSIHKKENHIELIRSKYLHPNNTMGIATSGYSLFPDYMWAQLATSWGIDTTNWYSNPDGLLKEIAKIYYVSQERRHSLISESRENNYQWLRKKVFNGLSPEEWEAQYSSK